MIYVPFQIFYDNFKNHEHYEKLLAHRDYQHTGLKTAEYFCMFYIQEALAKGATVKELVKLIPKSLHHMIRDCIKLKFASKKIQINWCPVITSLKNVSSYDKKFDQYLQTYYPFGYHKQNSYFPDQ
jgi:hypothetical protein